MRLLFIPYDMYLIVKLFEYTSLFQRNNLPVEYY